MWHASIFCGSTGASILSKSFNTVFSKSICLILWGIPEISINSLLEYCSFSQHFLSNLVTWSTSLLLTFLCDFTIVMWDKLVSGFDDKFKVHSLMFSGSQAKPNGISKVYCYRKVDREIHTLALWHMIGHQLFVSESTGNIFEITM